MREREEVERECVTPLTSRRSSLLQGLGAGLAVALLAWLSADGDARWALMVIGVVVTCAAAPFVFPVETLWLEGSLLVHERRGKTLRLDLSRLVSVDRQWVPKKGDDLVLVDRAGARVAIWVLDERTEQLRRLVGERARVVNASTDLFDRKTRRLLFLD